MGDEELNFTEEEARSWADDPRNQAASNIAAPGLLALFVLLLFALIAGVLATASDHSKSGAGDAHGAQVHSAVLAR